MYRGFVLLFLVLALETRGSESSCQQSESQRSVSNESPSFRLPAHSMLRRYNDIDYDSFVGLMGRRSADADDSIPPQRKREMHDIFVGLMGRRNTDSDTRRPWRKEYPESNGGIFFNKCKLRFRRGL
ncbi:tachykinin-3a isoform X1 [Misgurnus anguillicaudatus]|uniref:tachykinin-3a isoform X1 n=1 Tax=Misgurnus anguillicaudatus TaxID=75329 RepID=UPI0024351126|nr:tachykinin-3a isoform X1 [Misgurnus anguillicaudatus]